MEYNLKYNQMGKPVLRRNDKGFVALSFLCQRRSLFWGVWDGRLNVSICIEDQSIDKRMSFIQRLKPITVRYRGEGLFVPSEEDRAEIEAFALAWERSARGDYPFLTSLAEHAQNRHWQGRTARIDGRLYRVEDDLGDCLWRLCEESSEFRMEVEDSFFMHRLVDPANPYDLTQEEVTCGGQSVNIVEEDLSKYGYWLDDLGNSYHVNELERHVKHEVLTLC